MIARTVAEESLVRVLFVCLGNICRSPTAHGVFRKLVAEAGLAKAIESDSAGVSDYHLGEPPDLRALAAAKRRGVDISDLRARPVMPADLAGFHHILAMDEPVLRRLSVMSRRLAPAAGGRIGLFLAHAPQLGLREVPDPYLGGEEGFEDVLDMVEAGAKGLLDAIRREGLA